MKQFDRTKVSLLLVGLGGVVIGFIMVGLPAGLLLLSCRLNFPIANTAAADAQTPMLPSTPSPTFLQLWTSTPLVSISETPTASKKPTKTPTQQNVKLIFAHTQAADLMSQGNNQEAVMIWDQVIASAPDDANAYYMRGSAYALMIDKLRDYGEMQDYLQKAKEDADKAIALAPLSSADMYILRGYLLWRMADNLMLYRVNRPPILEKVAENYQIALNMGTPIRSFERNFSNLNLELGRCQESLAETKRLVAARDPALPESFQLDALLSDEYVCLEQYDKALEYQNRALKISPDDNEYKLEKAKILSYLRRYDEAYDIVNKLITDHPPFGGGRYYLRAWIHYNRGEKDLAAQDLDQGAGETWNHEGLYAYLRARLALDAGQRQEAIRLLQYAEATIIPAYEPAIYKRIQFDMGVLNIQPLSEAPDEISMVMTSIPTEYYAQITPQFVATQTSNIPQYQLTTPTGTAQPIAAASPAQDPRPIGSEDSVQVDMNTGTGKLVLKPGAFPLFHFKPTSPLSVFAVKKITLMMYPEKGGARPQLQFSFWCKEGGWRLPDATWGKNEIEYPSFYILSNGDFYIAIHNYTNNQTITIDNLGFSVTVETMDGTIQTYGLPGNN